MQAQTHTMSLNELSEIHDSLGDHKNILANSWHLMSDPDIDVPLYNPMADVFPETGGALPTVPGSIELLPTGIQEILDKPAIEVTSGTPPQVELPTDKQLKTIAGFVADGDPRFQQGSHLDAGLMEKGAEILDQGAMRNNATNGAVNSVVQDIFSSAGRDPVIAHEMITGNGDMVGTEKGRPFLWDVAANQWTDDGAAARTLTDWVDDAANNDNPVMDRMAGETAFAIADFLGDGHDRLTNLYLWPPTVGQLNPELVQGYAEALAPYQEAMVGDHRERVPGFGPLDGQADGNYEHARKIFAIINSDPTAASFFNEQAYQSILEYQQVTRDAVLSPGPADGVANSLAGRMLGVINGGADLAQVDNGYEMRREALSTAVNQLSGKLPIIGDLGADYLTNQILGDNTFDRVQTHSFTEVERMQRWIIASALAESGVPLTGFDSSFMDGTRLKTPEEIHSSTPELLDVYYQNLRDYAANNGWGDPLTTFGDEYDRGHYDVDGPR